MKSILTPIQPKWCEKIVDGKQTIIVRKTVPKCDVPFKCYIYCTKNNRTHAFHLYINDGYGKQNFGIIGHWRSGKEIVDVNSHLPAYRYNSYLAEGKVIGEFVCDKVTYIQAYRDNNEVSHLTNIDIDTCQKTCLNPYELFDYITNCTTHTNISYNGCLWHISDLKIYDKPRELSEFWYVDKCPYATAEDCTYKYHCFRAGENNHKNGRCGKQVQKPPQSWMYVEER